MYTLIKLFELFNMKEGLFLLHGKVQAASRKITAWDPQKSLEESQSFVLVALPSFMVFCSSSES